VLPQAVPLVKATLTKGLGAKSGSARLGLSQNNRRVCACLDTHKVDDKYGGRRSCPPLACCGCGVSAAAVLRSVPMGGTAAWCLAAALAPGAAAAAGSGAAAL
jgi:hypothetical protein